MNIFYTDKNPYQAARDLCDKHIPKMLLETVQMLCTAHHVHGEAPPPLYRVAHLNHPMSVWVRENRSNYHWALLHAFGIAEEYRYRFGKVHASEAVLMFLPPSKVIPEGELTTPPQCMPEEYKTIDAVDAYRAYYIGDKARFAKWEKGAPIPHWFRPQDPISASA